MLLEMKHISLCIEKMYTTGFGGTRDIESAQRMIDNFIESNPASFNILVKIIITANVKGRNSIISSRTTAWSNSTIKIKVNISPSIKNDRYNRIRKL